MKRLALFTALMLALPIAAAMDEAAPDALFGHSDWRSITETDPAAAAGAVGDGWLALTLPAQAGTRSPCCWTGRWDRAESRGCSLDGREHSFGNARNSAATDLLRLFAKVDGGTVQRLVLVGPDCPVDASGQAITALESATPASTHDWLSTLARSGSEDLSHQAMYALAQSDGTQVNQTLAELAREPGEWPARDAVFWLGEARGEAGARELDRLLDELPPGEIRQSVNFALAQNDSALALARLERVAREDAVSEQRADALFWLAESRPERARPLLLEALDGGSDTEVMEQAVFAVSQLGDGSGDALLFEIAGDAERSKQQRRQALFWLAQSDSEATLDRLAALLTRNP